MTSKDRKNGMNSMKSMKTKNTEEKKRPTRLEKLPKRPQFQSSLKNSSESGRHRNGFSKSVCESFGFVTPKKLGYPTENHLKVWHETRTSVPHDLSSLKIGGRRVPTRISSLEGDDVSSGSKSLSEGRREKEEIIVNLPSNFSDSSSESSSKELKLPSLPSIPSNKEVPKAKNFGRKEALKLSTNLDLIESRRKSKTFQKAKKLENNFSGSNGVDAISSIQLETQLSLPKITIDEVLKSWDIQPKATRRKRASSNASMKHDPMGFLTQRQTDLENIKSLQENFSACYEDVKGCRYLRIGKDEEEQGILHSRNCPCNSCEHVEALKESPYLNA